MGGLVIETIRPGVQFVPDAAKAFRRAEAQVQREFRRNIGVNSTYRSWNQQMSMYNAWNRYVNGTGPYPGHSKAIHPKYSRHTNGTALDSNDWTSARIRQILADNGFIRNQLHVLNEQHHFEYIRGRDKNYGKPASGGNATPITPEGEEEDEDMARNIIYRTTDSKAKIRAAVTNDVSGLWVEFTANDAGPLNGHAKAFGTGDAITCSTSMFSAARDAAAKVRAGKA